MVSSINPLYSYYSKMRITGFASGLDTDQIVYNLMLIERSPYNKLYQKKQLAEWKRDAYREVISLLKSVKDEYFNSLKPATNMLSQSAYKTISVVSSNNKVVTATGSTSAVPGSYKVKVEQIATAAKAVSSSGVTALLKSSENITAADIASAAGKSITVTLDGVSKQIVLGNYSETTSIDEVKNDLQTKINAAFGSGKVVVGVSEGEQKLTFQTAAGATRITLSSGNSNDGLQYLKIDSGSSNRLNTSLTLEALATKFANQLTFDENNELVFAINGEEFRFSKNTTLSSMMSTINNNQKAGVTIRYDEVTDKFVITAKQTGKGENIKITQTGGNFFDVSVDGSGSGASGINVITSVEEGKDALVIINGETIRRSTNTFTVNGVTYTLHSESNEIQTIDVNFDVDAVVNNIKSFVEKYNEMIDKINSKLTEKYDRNYPPLTEDQKRELTEDEIEKWETKAKTGLLRNDSILQNIVSKMRRALYDAVEGVGISLTEIGITTGSYEQKGKLVIDENKLRKAITDNPDAVMKLFNKQSENYPSYRRTLTSEERNIRYKESGLAQRLYDIIEDHISTMKDSYGNKGVLLEKAGMEGDSSEYTNLLYKEIKNYESEMLELYEKLIEKENQYYQKFATMEKLIAQMNSQSSWLTAQFLQTRGY